MDLSIYAIGPGFSETSDLKSVVDLLGNYELTFNRCLKRACILNNIAPSTVNLRLNPVGSGSLDMSLVTDIAAAVAPLAPQIFGSAWQLYKSAYDLIMIAVNRHKTTGQPMTITITDSPGAIVNVVNGDQIQTSNDVLSLARFIHPYLNKIAMLVKDRQADSIKLGADLATENDNLNFDRTNQDSFKVQEQDAYEDAPVIIGCDIYRFNKKTLNGNLEIQDEDQKYLLPFTVSRDLRDKCLEAIRSSETIITANREITTNALGETKVKKLHIIDIAAREPL